MSVPFLISLLISSAVAISISNLITKVSIQQLCRSDTGYRGVLLIYQLVSVIVVFLVWIIESNEMNIPSTELLSFLVVTGVSGALSLIVIYKGLSLGRMTIIFPLANASPIVTFLLAIAFLGESPGVLGWIGVVVATLAIASLSSVGILNNIKLRKELLYGVVSLTAWGIYYFAITPLVSRFGILGGTFYASAAVLVILFPWFVISHEPNEMGATSMYYGSVIGVTGSIGLILYSASVTMGPTSIVNPLHAALISLLSILAGVIFLNESLNLRQYLFLLLLISGTIILSYSVI